LTSSRFRTTATTTATTLLSIRTTLLNFALSISCTFNVLHGLTNSPPLTTLGRPISQRPPQPSVPVPSMPNRARPPAFTFSNPQNGVRPLGTSFKSLGAGSLILNLAH
ncbi:hypothetical protein FS837_006378, partial [Tulasnella sp. UAMH 9824]